MIKHPFRRTSTIGALVGLLLALFLMPALVSDDVGFFHLAWHDFWNFSLLGQAHGLVHGVLRFILLWIPLHLFALIWFPKFHGLSRHLTFLGLMGLACLLPFATESIAHGTQNHTTLGLGSVLWGLSSLLLIARGLAHSGIIRGDTFIAYAILVSSACIALFVLYPIGVVLIKCIHDPESGWQLSQFTETISNYSQFWRVLGNSLLLAVVVGILAPVIGLVFALITARCRYRWRAIFYPICFLPIITPQFVVGISLILLFGLQGTITAGLLNLQTRLIFGFPGLVIAQTLSFASVAYLVLLGSVQSMRPSLEEASLTMRANRWQTFWKVTFPLLRPGLANAFLLTVIESLADFGNPIIIGGDFEVLATEIYFSIVGRFDQKLASALGVVLLGFSLTAFILQRYWIGEKSYVTVTGKPAAAKFLPLAKKLEWGLLSICFVWSLFIVVVYGSVFLGGFVKLWGINHTFTLMHYQGLLNDGTEALKTTLWMSGVAAPVTAFIGLLLAYLIHRHQFIGRKTLEFCSLLSFAVPGTVIGIGYVMAFNQAPLILTGTALIIIISFVFRSIPVGMRSGLAALAQIDRALEEASLTLRASFAQTFWKVVIPLVRPALFSALVVAFVRSMTAISAIVFLVSPKWQVSTKVILDQAESGRLGMATAYSTVLIVIMALVTIFSEWVTRRFIRGVRIEGVNV